MDRWVHVAAVFDEGMLSLYVDGQRGATDVDVGEGSFPACSGREIRLGAAAYRSEQWLGWIDEWAMLDVSLTESQIAYIIENGLKKIFEKR